MAKTSTPMGFAAGPAMIGFHALVHASGPNEWVFKPSLAGSCETPCRMSFSADQPPTSFIPSQTTGANPSTIMKNCRTSVYMAEVNPPFST